MKKITLRNLAALLLALALLCALFTACGNDDFPAPVDMESETETNAVPLSICVDIKDLLVISNVDGVAGVQMSAESVAADLFRGTIKDRGGPEDVEFEFLPANGQERDAAISRIRTEIVSGKGPDVFIVNCINNESIDALFKSPGAQMELNLFLPLDEYISNAKYMEWDKLNPVVMAAGKNEEGQQLLPLTYTFPVTVFKKQDVSFQLSQDTTFYDMLEGGTDVLAAAMANVVFRHWWSDYAFGAVADYGEGQLLFSREDLLKWEEAQQDWYSRLANGELEDVPAHYSTSINVNFDTKTGEAAEFYKNVLPGDELTFIPMYSTQGGVAATILSFAAINRNTQRPDEAFSVLDALLDREVQQYSDIFKVLSDGRGIPVHQELMRESYPVAHWYMDDSLYEEFCAARDQITTAKFRSVFENELFAMDTECFREGGDLEQVVSKAYTTMQMILAES